MSEFERITEWTPAFDKRDPEPSKNYGIHGMNLRFVLKGDRGAVQFLVFTAWQLEHVQAEMDQRHDGHFGCHPMPADLGYHSLTPRYEDHQPYDCEYVEGGKCYYDGSSLNAEPVWWRFVADGEPAVWEELERYYARVFDVCTGGYRAESCGDQAEYIDEGERVCERHSRDAGDGYDVRRISEA